MKIEDLARHIESTLLKPEASEAMVGDLCDEALRLNLGGVCVSPSRVGFAAGLLRDSSVAVVTVAGFPLGTQTRKAKVAEVAELSSLGAEEIDMVMNVGFFLEGRLSAVASEIAEAKVEAAPARLKVILETSLLTPEGVRTAGSIAAGAGADFLKTSTGYGAAGATLENVRILREVAGARCGVKAAGGIRTYQEAIAMIEAGADRLGASAAAQLMKGAKEALTA